MKGKNLQWWDIIILSIIFFETAVYNSMSVYFSTDASILAQGTEFTAADNIYGIITILIELTIAFLYLKCRKFDFSQWKYKITIKDTIFAIGIYIFVSLALDAADIFILGWDYATNFVGTNGYLEVIKSIDLSLILFSFLNGFYEEIFFLGICFAVPDSQRFFVILYSFVVRYSFHTYQGILPAVEIGFLLGGLYFIMFKRSQKNLYPFMLAHAFADIFGAGILGLL